MSIRQAARGMLCALAMVACGAGEAAQTYTADDYKRAVAPCLRARDYDCAQKNWTSYLKLRPTDTQAIANLGIVMNMRDDHAGAVVQFEKAIEMGEGTYDLFAYYADSLAKLGRTDDAIDWSYKSLAVWPQLVDVRVPGGRVSEAGLRNNIAVGLQYLAAWLGGSGAVAINNLMEDAATAEISRSQLWQWIRHGARTEAGDPITPDHQLAQDR